ncbi:MAG TPA: acetate--CoA ligase [Polyangiaceae bacterium]|nr:acetate--CoA ligase [Polyangiaceae bacterium]
MPSPSEHPLLAAARTELAGGAAAGGLNIAEAAVDRHVNEGRGDRVALRWLGKRGDVVDLRYRDLAALANQFGNALRSLGVGAGDRVFALTGRVPELYQTVLGTLKNRSVLCPLFAAFGPEPIRTRLEKGQGRVLVTTDALYRKKILPIRAALPALEHVISIDLPEDRDGALSFHRLVDRQATSFVGGQTKPDDPALLHFTSGTTGSPKGAVHVHEAVVVHHATARYALGLEPADVFWCTADPGWVTGTSYGIVAPLTCGVTSIVDEAEFEAERWYENLEKQRVSVFYTAPTAIRMLMRAGADLARGRDLSRLRFVASVGEPLNPDAVTWGEQAFGMPIRDNWWQTETGGIMIANVPGMTVRPGSMGKPLPWVEAGIVRRGAHGLEEIREPDVEGELALRPGWPSMFRAYLNEPARYEKCFEAGWYLTGDLAKRDADGYYWFVGRADDVIKTAGHLIGPFEVESTLLSHPAVVEAAVIGKPDPLALNIVKAFVVPRPGYAATDALRDELIGFARKKLGPAVAPREIAFVESVPKTRSGKVMRRLLRARELGLEEGDTSTLEGGPE